MTLNALRMLQCAGSPLERGRAQGEAFQPLIAAVIPRWRAALETRHQMDADTYIAAFLAETSFIPAIEQYTPGLLMEVRGIAEGAGQPFETMLAYNLMDEEWQYGGERSAQAPGCTVACLVPADGPPVIAQTMDIPVVHDGTQVVVHHQPGDAPEMMIFTAAGMIALNGANRAGIGVVVNNLSMLPSSRNGLPVMFVIRGILQQTTLAAAVDFCEHVPHAIGQHYAIGAPDGIAGLEAAATGVTRTDVSAGRYVHANHPLARTDVDASADTTYAASRTFTRHDRAVELIADVTDQVGIEQILMDDVAPISCAPMSGYMTFGGTAISCSVTPVVRIAPGPPHATPWVSAGFAQ